jgi:hypothetical protein
MMWRYTNAIEPENAVIRSATLFWAFSARSSACFISAGLTGGGSLIGRIQWRAKAAREPRCPFDLVSFVDGFVVMRASLCQRRQAPSLCWRSRDHAGRLEQLTGGVLRRRV